MTKIGEHAVVLGASMGGLSAARVLADYYDTVTVVERDVLPPRAANRRGVPQGRHGHAILGRGLAVLNEFFPGFTDDLVGAGVPVLDYRDLSEMHMSAGGHLTTRNGGFVDVPPLYSPSRPLLESLVRQRLRSIGNISLLDGYDVLELICNADGDRVTGARIRSNNSGTEHMLDADLVVDAMGRAARTPAFLDALGYGRPPEEQVKVRVTYASQLLRLPPGTLREKIVLVSPVPGRTTGMALLAHEDDTWMLTVFGVAGCRPPDEFAEMVAVAAGFAPEHLVDAIRAGEPLSEVSLFGYPESRWRRYDKLRRFPGGLLVLGDAMCSFNPIYGQGMTVALLQAESLGRCLQDGPKDLARRYFRAAAKPIAVAWKFASGADLNLPEIEGNRPLSVRLTNGYANRLGAVAEYDVEVAEQFLRVVGLLDPPANLLRPKMLVRAARHRRRSAAAKAPMAMARP
jgi:2-polyprenyl-6-methoxyphenol hydroxylase-like FAD-dependent oxidoreductase